MLKRLRTLRLARTIRRKPLKFIILFLVIVYAACIIVVMRAKETSFLNAILILMPSIFGELAEVTATPVDIALVASLALYVCFVGLIFGKLSEVLMNLSLRGGVIMKKVNHQNHIVICGWNYQGTKVVNGLLRSGHCPDVPVVILADLEKVPFDSPRVDFIQGVPWGKNDLARAGINSAQAAIVLTGVSSERRSNPDGDALMITLAIKNCNKDIHTCVPIHSSQNKIHLENAGADEIICLDQVGGDLAVSCAINHGISNVVNELLAFNTGDEFYRYKKSLPPEYIGKTFTEAGKALLEKHIILIGIETAHDGYLLKACTQDRIHPLPKQKAMIINPKGEYCFRENDSLFVIAKDDPQQL